MQNFNFIFGGTGTESYTTVKIPCYRSSNMIYANFGLITIQEISLGSDIELVTFHNTSNINFETLIKPLNVNRQVLHQFWGRCDYKSTITIDGTSQDSYKSMMILGIMDTDGIFKLKGEQRTNIAEWINQTTLPVGSKIYFNIILPINRIQI